MSDNGGAIAIKGFNYQKAAIMLVMIDNYQKQNFKVIPESKEDFEVHIDNEIYFIQVKGTKKLSVKNLIKREKKETKIAKSIIEKNLEPGTDRNKRKIFVHSLADTTKKDLISEAGTIVTPIYKLSDDQKKTVIDSLDLSNSQKNRLENQKFYITPFSNDAILASTHLKGKMVEKDLLVTKKRADLVLGALVQEIDAKSEIEVFSAKDIPRKIIDSEFLKEVFVNVQKKDMFDSILEKLPYNHLKKMKIGMEKTKLLVSYQSLKEKIKSKIKIEQLMDITSDEEVVAIIIKEIEKIEPTIGNEELKIAISIDCYCEIGGELT
ncbi:dsDNA nuclease domain-containing protein [Enterococcus sp. G203Y]|uniref:dsDNA nuclease domain-containing protein n=1 Tax=Enterococcus TaxID=1350 RepID=UPI0015E2965D|nr:dsDNA nuclease domain-containing protein [Enterococcus faecalis]